MEPRSANSFRADFGLAQKTVQAGVSLGRAKSTITAWQQWENFALELAIDPLLHSVQDKIPILQVFAQRVRRGDLATKGNPIRARSVEDYLRNVAQTFLGVGADDPRLNSAGDIDFRLKRMIAAWKKEDPPPHRVKPVPTQVLRRIAVLASQSSCPIIQATSDMIILAFFFLLRPGEYTATASETQPFELQHVQLFIGSRRINFSTATDAEILESRFCSLTFDKQKNGVRGEVIGLGLSGDPLLCPVRALGRRIIHLRTHNAPITTPLAVVSHHSKWTRITPTHITTALRDAVKFLGADLGFFPKDVSARCLRAAGANALLLSKVDSDVIRLIGRWRSDEMLRYLHVQAAPLMSDYAKRMLASGNFTLIPNGTVPMH